MQADVDHLRLFVDRQPDHWAMAVVNRLNDACLYRARSTSVHCGRCVLLEFVSCELGKRIREEDVTWVENRQGYPFSQEVAS